MSTQGTAGAGAGQQFAGPASLTRPAVFYAWLCSLSVACLIIGDIVGIKLFQFPLWGKLTVQHTCGMLTFPITFLITDLLNEYYGKKAARRVAIVSFVMAMVVFVVINVAQAMPAWNVPFNVSQESFDQIFGSAKIMYVASLTAYLVGSLCDIWIFGLLKRLTGGKHIWLRATGSTVVSQAIDSFIVTYLAFSLGRQLFPSGTAAMTFPDVLTTAATGYVLKFVIAVVLTPVIYAGKPFVKNVIGLRPLPTDAQG
jgi:queuosine precursor transporter